MSEIKISNLTFCYEGGYENIFDNVSFTLDTDRKLGLIGRNGRGKTTLLKLLQGIYEYTGSIVSPEDFEYFPFELKDSDEMLTGMELIEKWDPDNEYWRVCIELSELGLSPEILERSFGKLSKGEQTKVMLAVLFSKENAFLLIDEPTNHLDIEGRELLGKYLNGKKGFILVSHDRQLLNSCIDHVISINIDDIEVVKGNFASWYENKSARDAAEIKENLRLKRDIRRLSESARRAEGWSDKVEKTKNGKQSSGLKGDKGHIGHMAAKAMKRAKNIESRKLKAIDEKKGLLKNIEIAEELILMPLKYHKERLIEVRNAGLAYDVGCDSGKSQAGSAGAKQIVEALSFSVDRGDKLVIEGRNGSGKSSIINYILKESGIAGPASCPVLTEGDFRVASGLKISYVPQDTDRLSGLPESVIEGTDTDRTLFFSILRKLDFGRDELLRDMRELSSGQKKKVLIAKSLCERAHLYIWDEPLNYIDVFSRIQLENLIKKSDMTMIFIEHDMEFSRNVCNKTVRLQAPAGSQNT